MVVGISLMYSARILGYARDFAVSAFDGLFGLAWFGFAMNAVSGVLLFFGEPRRLMDTPAFWIKMILIVFAGLALWALARRCAEILKTQLVSQRRVAQWLAKPSRRPTPGLRRFFPWRSGWAQSCRAGSSATRCPRRRCEAARYRHDMTEGEVLHWIKELPLGAAVRESRWMFAMGRRFTSSACASWRAGC